MTESNCGVGFDLSGGGDSFSVPQHFWIRSDEEEVEEGVTNFVRRFLERKGEKETVKTFFAFANRVLMRDFCLRGVIVRVNFP